METSGSETITLSVWFCFSKIIQEESDKVKYYWNSHYIRQSKHDTVSGVPDILFFLSEYSGANDCLCLSPQTDVHNDGT